MRLPCGRREVDEVGRGPLAGPVRVAAVVLDPHDLPEGLDDSKALCEAERDSLRPVIFAKALSVWIVFASAEEIDAYNIRAPRCAPWRAPFGRSASSRIWR
jgi:ribonuclease HII